MNEGKLTRKNILNEQFEEYRLENTIKSIEAGRAYENTDFKIVVSQSGTKAFVLAIGDAEEEKSVWLYIIDWSIPGLNIYRFKTKVVIPDDYNVSKCMAICKDLS